MKHINTKKLLSFLFGLVVFSFSISGWAYENIVNLTSLTGSGDVSVNFTQEKAVVIFLSESCPCSDSHIEHFIQLKKDFPDYKFIGIQSSVTKTMDSVKKYYTSKNLNFPVIADPAQKRVKEFGALRTPHVFVLQNGEIVYKGGVTNDANFSTATEFYLKDALASLSKGKPAKDGTKKLHGCYIDRD